MKYYPVIKMNENACHTLSNLTQNLLTEDEKTQA